VFTPLPQGSIFPHIKQFYNFKWLSTANANPPC
jgi:hypothetical protein